MSLLDAKISFDQFQRTAPAAVAALRALTQSVDDSGLEKSLTELIKVRASQINGCAFCLQFHLNLARKVGVEAVKLDLVAVWREAGVFTPRELAALAWTEALTLLAPEANNGAGLAALREQFDETEALFLTLAISTINQWNRIAGPLGFPPPLPKVG